MSGKETWEEHMRVTRPLRENVLRILYPDQEIAGSDIRAELGLPDKYDWDVLEALLDWNLIEITENIGISDEKYSLSEEGRKLVEEEIIKNESD